MKMTLSMSLPKADAYLLPIGPGMCRNISLGKELDEAVDLALNRGLLAQRRGGLWTLTMPYRGTIVSIVCVRMDPDSTPRQQLLDAAPAFRRCKELKAQNLAVCLDNLSELDLSILFRLPLLVDYVYDRFKTSPTPPQFQQVTFVTRCSGLEMLLSEGIVCAEATLTARELCNQPASVQTPESLGMEAERLGREYGFETQLLSRQEITDLGMESYLAVARGAHNAPPVLIVMRWNGRPDGPVLGLIGKGVVYDSGGYSLKSGASMKTMFDDMGGAAAVIGAMCAAARQNLPIRVVGVIAACENRISNDAYAPGDVIGSMCGKHIEVLNTDAEGRLTLADAITYAIRKEGCSKLLDIATLTGAAKGAVGRHTAAVMASDEVLWSCLSRASSQSAEKIWRLDTDEELMSVLSSTVADLKNSNPGNTYGGGTIVAGLFIREFTEHLPWIHVDMAPVNYRADGESFCAKGATGYGAALLYYFMKNLCEEEPS